MHPAPARIQRLATMLGLGMSSVAHGLRWPRVACAVMALPAAVVSAQTPDPSLWFVRGGVNASLILPTDPLLPSASTAGGAQWGPNLTLELGRRTDGSSAWHRLYGIPSYGVGVSVASFRRGDGAAVRPLDAYGFFSWPFASLTDRVDVTTDFSLGVSWNWMATAADGRVQPVLASNLNARIDWGFYTRFLLSSRSMLYTGVDFTHRSNGGLVQPNLGINVLGPKMMLQYDFGPFRDGVDITPRQLTRPSGFHSDWTLVAGVFGGLKNVIETTTPLVRQDFGALDATVGLQHRFYPFGRLVFGSDGMYDGSIGVATRAGDPQWRASPVERWAVGLFGGYEHIIGRFAAGVHVGYKVMRGFADAESRRLYQRFGLSYSLSDRVFSTFAVRAIEGRKADALEIGVGYRLYLRRGFVE